jgi:TPR repeat protein
MANTYSNTIVEDLIWAEIAQSACAQDFLDYTNQFPTIPTQHWFEALDQAVSLFSPSATHEGLAAGSRYPAAFEKVKAFAEQTSDESLKAIAVFNLGKMADRGLGTLANRDESIRYYKQAIALGEPRALINCASFFEGSTASESDLAFADDLYRQALEKGEPMGLVFQAARFTDDDDPRRYELHLQAAEMGCAAAMHRVGVAHIAGSSGQAKDESLGLSWIQRAAKAGHHEASYFLGWYYDREAKNKDLPLSVEWHQLGASQGNRAAMRVLSINLIDGEGIEANEAQGVVWLNRAAVLGDRYAQFHLGKRLMEADSIDTQKTGLAWLTMAADNGHDYAAWRVAQAYQVGTACEKDLVKASRYCEIAAKAGYGQAQGQLGLNYWYGEGVEKDYDKAYKWISMCAFQGESHGLYLLGLMTDQGHGCTADYAEALRLYRKAADKGSVSALRQIGECYYFGHGVERDYAEAVLWYQKAAAQGNAKAMTDMGWMLREGEGVLTNYEEAAAWFEKAAALDDSRAMYLLALMYENGDGVEESEEACRRWMGRSAMLDYKPAKEWIEKHLPKAPDWLEQLVNPNE